MYVQPLQPQEHEKVLPGAEAKEIHRIERPTAKSYLDLEIECSSCVSYLDLYSSLDFYLEGFVILPASIDFGSHKSDTCFSIHNG